jgi:hypothetical protein
MEKRQSDRTSLSLDFSTRMVLEGETYTGVPVTNLGLNGCCVRLPASSSAHLKNHALVGSMLLSRSDSETFAVKARIAWHDAPRFGGGKWVNAGVEFLELPGDCVRELRERVAEDMANREP